MGEAVIFYVLSALILGFAVLVISTRNTVHSVLFLVMNFLLVAMLYVMLGAEFLAVIQVLVYAGGIVVLYLFVVMLVNLKRPPEVHQDPYISGRNVPQPWAALVVEEENRHPRGSGGIGQAFHFLQDDVVRPTVPHARILDIDDHQRRPAGIDYLGQRFADILAVDVLHVSCPSLF